ncbi:hypothetical protein M513_14436, partial [Trichuris suis]
MDKPEVEHATVYVEANAQALGGRVCTDVTPFVTPLPMANSVRRGQS